MGFFHSFPLGRRTKIFFNLMSGGWAFSTPSLREGELRNACARVKIRAHAHDDEDRHRAEEERNVARSELGIANHRLVPRRVLLGEELGPIDSEDVHQ